LMASLKGRLQPIAKQGLHLRKAIASIFRALWLGQAEADDLERLLLWIKFVSNRVDVWKESAA
jgi:hypothetical protein